MQIPGYTDLWPETDEVKSSFYLPKCTEQHQTIPFFSYVAGSWTFEILMIASLSAITRASNVSYFVL